MGQQLIGHHLHIRPDLADQLDQGQGIQCPQGVIGNDHHPSAGRDVELVPIRDRVAEREVVQYLFDEGVAVQVLMLFKKLVDLPFMDQQAEDAKQGAGEGPQRRIAQVRIFVCENLFDIDHVERHTV